VLVEIRSGDEEGGGEWIDEDDATRWLPSLVPLRADLAGGDLRALYLAWLMAAQNDQLDDGDTEPPCPPGLRSLSAPLDAFVEFMRLDRDLVEAAAAGSPAVEPADAAALEGWASSFRGLEKSPVPGGLWRARMAPGLRVDCVHRPTVRALVTAWWGRLRRPCR
jgi:hypothetical protein